jgi:selenocysteine-specific elongation factor
LPAHEVCGELDAVSSLIVGTAGHIDHGKSALVLALTGTDPDRLKEEKERGITIDLGFAHADLGDGVTASFIDVPGHERFVRNMLAGAHGLDAVLLVVAADESVMPQTREHFHICRLLGIGRGLVALTKCDVADEESQALARLEVRELVAGSFLEGREVLAVSARTGAGLPALRAALKEIAGQVGARAEGGLLRLPVDRAFTLRGFGTVVTGTVVAGAVAVGDEVEILPAGHRARVRGLHVHGEPAERVAAGSRAAANLAGVETKGVGRGSVLASPGQLRATSLLDAELTLLPEHRAIEDGARVRLHVASAEVLARVRVLDGERVTPEAPRLVQLRLERPVAAGRADRLIVRSYSPATTIGGAVVLDPLPPKRRRADRPGLERLRSCGDDLRAAGAALVAEAGVRGLDLPSLVARLTVPGPQVVEALRSRGDLLPLGDPPLFYLGREALAALGDEALRELRRFHGEQPLRHAMPREELRRRVFARSPEPAFALVLGDLEAAGRLRLSPDTAALVEHKVTLSAPEADARALLLREASEAGLAGLDLAAVAARGPREQHLLERVAKVLVDEGLLLRVGGSLVDRERLDELKREVRRRWPPGSRLDVGEFKDLTGLTRKFVIPLLEFLDRERVTRRSGNDRLVLA